MKTLRRGSYELLERRTDRAGVEVWSARQRRGGRAEAAVEVLRFPAGDESQLRIVETELRRRIAALSAWAEATVIDATREREALLVVSHPLEGHDLATLWRLSAEGGVGLPLQVAAKLLRDAARALARMQAVAGTPIHAELLPSSVLLTPSGQGVLRDVAIPWTTLGPGDVRRWRYRSPEEARGDAAGPASDQFTLGVLLWEACAGRRLFPGGDVDEVRRLLCGQPIQSLQTLVPGFPPDLDQLVTRLLARDPAGRFDTFDQVADGLETYLHRTAASLGDISPQAFLQAVARRKQNSPVREPPLRRRDRPPPVPLGTSEDSGPVPLPPATRLRPPPFPRDDDGERADPAWGWLLAGGSVVFSVALVLREVLVPAPPVAPPPVSAVSPSEDLGAQAAQFEALLTALGSDDPTALESVQGAMASSTTPKLGAARARHAARLSLVASAVARQAAQAAQWFEDAEELGRAEESAARAARARLDAYTLAGEARTFGSDLPEAALAMVAYLAERGAQAELEVELEVFSASLLQAELSTSLRERLHAEALVQRRLAQLAAAMERAGTPPPEAPRKELANDNRVQWSELLWVSQREATTTASDTTLLGRPTADDPRGEAFWLAIHRRAASNVSVAEGVHGEASAGSSLDARIAAARGKGRAEELIAVASQALERGDCHWAAVGFREALQLDAGNLAAWQGLGWASIDLGDNDEAVRAFRSAVTLPAASHEARFGLAEAYRFAGELEQAVAAYEDFLSRAPEGPDAAVARNVLVQLRD